ncbi:contractile injection system protein, VgrG/Pvc8 family [Orenia marismortui]|uniref:contractile injection system protein, VgrG/Pvc8 family n=1 Tax=Orenia marismortui TaxID=46469 RepID=UPI000368CD19|nr:hypothetical protein [Orenia marismortui]
MSAKGQRKSDDLPITYTSKYKIKFDNFEFIALDKFEIKKSIYDHSKVSIAGVISEDNLADYERYLEQQDPKLVITYDNDDSKILFKGIIKNYSFAYKNHDYFLNLEGISYSSLLSKRRNNRIYQNLETTYQEVFDQLMEANSEFNLTFADDSLGTTPLVSADYPVVLQYKESEWDFIRRIASYLNQLVIVDDTKDNSEKINIQVGPHNAPAKELNNVFGAKRKKTARKNIKFNYYKVKGHEHFRSDNIFDVGKKVNYKLSNQSEDTIELIIIKNRIYIANGILSSDLTLLREDEINLAKERRKISIAGRSFRAEVKKVEKNHKAQVQFIDLEDKFDQSKAFYFPIDKPYTNAYFAPEVGDIVDIYFKSKNEKHATLKSSSIDKEEEIENEPADKIIITPGGYKIRINNDSILISAKDDKSLVELQEESITMLSEKNRIKMNKDLIEMKTKKGKVVMDKATTELSFGGKKIEISNSGINMS